MSSISEKIIRKALILPVEERAEIIHRLLWSLNDRQSGPNPEWSADWEAELFD